MPELAGVVKVPGGARGGAGRQRLGHQVRGRHGRAEGRLGPSAQGLGQYLATHPDAFEAEVGRPPPASLGQFDQGREIGGGGGQVGDLWCLAGQPEGGGEPVEGDGGVDRAELDERGTDPGRRLGRVEQRQGRA
ncbi:hypothetical protein ACIQVR_34785 [Streptomyces xanthochromogenes]|uniref:hypothetical protein n=1 Tax=Streptomyces xanthochromogenes TaxID=67384 RepID=UPI00381BD462